MALLKCIECGHDVSDKAEMCPNCGCPVEESIKYAKSKKKLKLSTGLVIEDSGNPIIRQLSQKKYEEEWIKRIIDEIDEESKSGISGSNAQKKVVYCNINGVRMDVTWIKEAINKMDEVALEHCKYIWSKQCENDRERLKCLNQYSGTPQHVFYNRVTGISAEVRDRCDLSIFAAPQFLYELVDSNFELKEFYGESETEAIEKNRQACASVVKCPYCGSLDVRRNMGFAGGGFFAPSASVGKNWKCKHCGSYF